MADKDLPSMKDMDIAKPYDQFILFGDSITQMSSKQDMGFGFQPALQEGPLSSVARYMYLLLNSIQSQAGHSQSGFLVGTKHLPPGLH